MIFTNGLGVNAATEYPNAAAAFAIYSPAAKPVGDRENRLCLQHAPRSSRPGSEPQGPGHSQGGLLDDSRVAYWGPNTGKVDKAVSKALERIYLGDQNVATSFAQASKKSQAALK